MIRAIRRALLRRRIRNEDERMKVARDMRRFYEDMYADAEAKVEAASLELQHLENLRRLHRMAPT